jgi:hypothetical protein
VVDDSAILKTGMKGRPHCVPFDTSVRSKLYRGTAGLASRLVAIVLVSVKLDWDICIDRTMGVDSLRFLRSFVHVQPCVLISLACSRSTPAILSA